MKKAVLKVVSMLLVVVSLMTAVMPMCVQAAQPTYPLPELTGDMVQDIINVAISQLGYHEEGDNETAYGEWWAEMTGDKYYKCAPWCAMFATWCAYHAGASSKIFCRSAATNEMWGFYKSKGWVLTNTSSYPRVGDLIFYGTPAGTTNHVAIVVSFNYEEDTVTIIGGNQGDGEVTMRDEIWYPGTRLKDGRYILGYGRPQYPDSGEIVIPTPTPLPTPTPAPDPGPDGFVDVNEADWFYDSVVYAKEHSIMSGLTEDTFAPNDKLSRAQCAAIIYRMMGSPEVEFKQQFSDVKKGDWYASAVTWASQTGIVSGYGNGLFGSEDNVTREQMATMMYRYANYLALDTAPKMADISSYEDSDKVSGYALEATQWAVGYGLITGTTTTTLSPLGNTTRAECAAISQRFQNAYLLN